jgi:hypothetical protein
MVWKNGKTGFHAMELFPKLASMVWKTGESGFHGVEKRGPENERRLSKRQRGRKWVPCRGTFRKSGFHAVENGEFDFHTVELFAAQ